METKPVLKFFLKRLTFNYFSEMCMEQAFSIHAHLKEKICPYKLLEAKTGLCSLGYRKVSYIF